MNNLTPALLVAGLLVAVLAPEVAPPIEEAPPVGPTGLATAAHETMVPVGLEGPDDVIEQYCVRCHSDRRMTGNMSLESFDADAPEEDGELAERVIRKLRAGMMPPAGARRPPPDTLRMLAAALETKLDDYGARHPNPGTRSFQRLTRIEYARAIWDLLGLQVDVDGWLPPETMSGGFDNMADAQRLSPTLLDGYLTAASEITRLALGDPDATASETTYKVSRYAEQRERVAGAPFGTRGGVSVVHTFPADGEYVFRMSFQTESTGNFFGQTSPFDEKIEISIDGARMALLDVDRWMHMQDPDGPTLKSDPISIPAGPHRVSVTFLNRQEGPVEDLLSPHEWSLADKKIGYSYGITALPHLQDAAISGPWNVTGISDHPVRDRVLSCRPQGARQERTCAESIAREMGSKAFRRPLKQSDVDVLMKLYEDGTSEGGFEGGVRLLLQGILSSPDFVFRIEEAGPATAGGVETLGDLNVASRLSFFLWGSPPDDELLSVAAAGRLTADGELERQVDRMLDDPRSDAMGTRFASMWLRLQDLDKVHPDALAFPDFYQQLADDMRRETELFFIDLVREDRSFFEVLTADYTFLNERLARHYDVDGVTGPAFRRVAYPTENRRGILGHGSVLTLTSHANRTSPVLRGKWIMDVMLGTPPPPPPPDVPELDAVGEAVDGRFLTVREQMEQHRSNPTCNSCHRMMDPLGLALENFDVTGAWRIRDSGRPVDVQGEMYDGTQLTGPKDLRLALLDKDEALARTFTENLLSYAIGRRIEWFDMPTVRSIVEGASEDGYGMRRFIMGVVESPAFLMRGSEHATTFEDGTN